MGLSLTIQLGGSPILRKLHLEPPEMGKNGPGTCWWGKPFPAQNSSGTPDTMNCCPYWHLSNIYIHICIYIYIIFGGWEENCRIGKSAIWKVMSVLKIRATQFFKRWTVFNRENIPDVGNVHYYWFSFAGEGPRKHMEEHQRLDSDRDSLNVYNHSLGMT